MGIQKAKQITGSNNKGADWGKQLVLIEKYRCQCSELSASEWRCHCVALNLQQNFRQSCSGDALQRHASPCHAMQKRQHLLCRKPSFLSCCQELWSNEYELKCFAWAVLYLWLLAGAMREGKSKYLLGSSSGTRLQWPPNCASLWLDKEKKGKWSPVRY